MDTKTITGTRKQLSSLVLDLERSKLHLAAFAVRNPLEKLGRGPEYQVCTIIVPDNVAGRYAFASARRMGLKVA